MDGISLFPEDPPEGFPAESWVEIRYPLTKDQETGDRDAWPWLPGTIVQQCGEDEWQVVVEVRELATLEDGRTPRRNTPSSKLYYPLCFRDASEIRRAS